MRRTQVWALAAVAVIGCVGGCGRATQIARSTQSASVPAEDIPLHVQNNTRGAMKVLVVDEGMWKFVGLVEAGSTATFYVTDLDRDGAPLRVLATPVSGQGAARAGPLTVLPGQTVTFTIEPDLARSVATVR